ncbi:MAG: sigma-E factor negative regulatory protein [Rhodanobacteraceae bacterium]
MSEVSKQQLSALLDGELGADEARFLLRRIEAEPELAELWSRYQLIGDSLRHRACMPVTASLAVRVMRQIGEEQTSTARQRSSRWVRYGLGGSIAASVAVAALVWMQPRQPVSSTPVATEQTSVSSAPTLASSDANTATAAHDVVASPGPDLSSLLRQPGSAMLNVQPAAAIREQGPVLMSRTGGMAPVWMQVPARADHQPETLFLRERSVYSPPGVGPPRQQSQAQTLPH